MATPLSATLLCLWKPPRREYGSNSRPLNSSKPENFKYYRPWGFTIYRTYYGQDSDKHWYTLLEVLRQQTRLAVGYYDDREVMESDPYWKRGIYRKEGRYMTQLNLFKELFCLTAREDPLLLDGLDIRGIREVCVKEPPDSEKNIKGPGFGFALVADEAILKGISQNQYFVKAVGYDWEESRGGWGWDRLRTGQLLDLWGMLLDTNLASRSKYYDMGFDGPEEDLETHVWAGDFFLPSLSECCEVQIPKFYGNRSSISS